MVAMTPMVKWAQWKMRPFYKGFLHQWSGSKTQLIHITSTMRSSLPRLVTPAGKSLQLLFHSCHHMGNDNRHQQQGLGLPLFGRSGTGHLGSSFQKNSVKHLGIEDSISGTFGIPPSDIQSLGSTQTRHKDGSGIHKETRGYPESVPTSGGRTNYDLGPEEPSQYNSNICTWDSECPGRLSIPNPFRQQ